jgi:hypothetical protein
MVRPVSLRSNQESLPPQITALTLFDTGCSISNATKSLFSIKGRSLFLKFYFALKIKDSTDDKDVLII